MHLEAPRAELEDSKEEVGTEDSSRERAQCSPERSSGAEPHRAGSEGGGGVTARHYDRFLISLGRLRWRLLNVQGCDLHRAVGSGGRPNVWLYPGWQQHIRAHGRSLDQIFFLPQISPGGILGMLTHKDQSF